MLRSLATHTEGATMGIAMNRRFTRPVRGSIVALAVLLVVGMVPSAASAEDPDPRIGLGAGWLDAQSASSNMELLAHLDRPPGFFNPASPGSFAFLTSDLAFSGNHAFVGSFHGFNIVDISSPTSPTIVSSVVCPGGQGDMSAHRNLLF